MLIRFYPDVIAMQPKAVVIFGGTNDIAGNLGPVSLESVQQNLAAMADMARGNGIKVVMASVMPVCDLPGKPPMTIGRPPETILKLNSWIKDYAASHGAVYLDYYSVTVDDKGFFKAEMTEDGLHPTDERLRRHESAGRESYRSGSGEVARLARSSSRRSLIRFSTPRSVG